MAEPPEEAQRLWAGRWLGLLQHVRLMACGILGPAAFAA